MKDLQGKRIVITRPRDRADAFAEALLAHGAQPIFFPTIAIAPVQDTQIIDRALRRLSCYDWLILTSASAVEVCQARMQSLKVDALPDTLRIAAVGPKTAAAAATLLGAQPDFVPAEFTGESILPGLGDLRGRWVLLPLADIAYPTLSEGILAAGGVPHVVTAYHTLPARPDPDGLRELKDGVDVVAFTSGSTARNFIRLVQDTGLDPFQLPGKPLIACIGPKTARVAGEAGFSVAIVADTYTVDGLISALQAQAIQEQKQELDKP